ncbi:MAG: HEAT repeat domain-containing protein [bacterium]|nr:HEAT repeat domain-containing protein [bacterium]
MKNLSWRIVSLILTMVLIGFGCVRRKVEDEEKTKKGKPPKPAPVEEKVVIAPEVQQKVDALLAPAGQRELTDSEKDDLAAAFRELGKPGVICLVNELKKEDIPARRVIIETLGQLRDASAVEALTQQLKQRSEDVRRAAVKALGEIGDLKAVPALTAILQGDKKKRVRAEAATSLGLLRSKDAVIPLIQALDPTKETKRWVRRSAAEALGLIGDSQALEPLMDALNDREKVVRVAAMFGLYMLGDTKTLELLEQRAADPDEEVRQWAIRELGFVGASRSAPVLSAALRDPSLSVRITAVGSLGRIPSPESLDTLIAALKDPEVNIRAAAVEALRTRGIPPVGQGSQKLFDALAELIKTEPTDNVRNKARALYDLIKPTLPPSSPGTTLETPTSTPPTAETPGTS